MSETPKLYWKVRREVNGSTDFRWITKEEARTRGLLQQVLDLGEENAYVQISPQTFTPYGQWKRNKR